MIFLSFIWDFIFVCARSVLAPVVLLLLLFDISLFPLLSLSCTAICFFILRVCDDERGGLWDKETCFHQGTIYTTSLDTVLLHPAFVS